MRALGFSLTPFDPVNPGRLCRGRERWIEGYPIESGPPIQRLVVSGASFQDDSARDAQRGLSFSGIGAGELLRALFPKQEFLAFAEQGNPLRVPEGTILCEEHLQPRFGGGRMDPCVRWRLPVRKAEEVDAVFGVEPSPAEGLIPFDGLLTSKLEEALFLLTGQADRLSPPERRIQPSALQSLLECVPFVVVAHLDKHAGIVAIYAREFPVDPNPRLSRLAESKGVLPVPFSIPPMLARWDRALFELRLSWEKGGGEPFPVPPGEDETLNDEREFPTDEE